MACEDGPVFYEVMQRTVPDGVEEIRDFRGLMEHLPQLSGEKSSEKQTAPRKTFSSGARCLIGGRDQSSKGRPLR